jgi:hypothetical protein
MQLPRYAKMQRGQETLLDHRSADQRCASAHYAGSYEIQLLGAKYPLWKCHGYSMGLLWGKIYCAVYRTDMMIELEFPVEDSG